jgi:deoxyribodipyrimidine photo-lyase
MKRHTRGLHLFRRDLRLEDNTSLNHALEECEEVLGMFIFDSEQKEHDYFSYNGFDFMIESLEELRGGMDASQGRLLIMEGEAIGALSLIIEGYKPEALYFNEDYTPFSKERDSKIVELCARKGIECKSFTDAILFHPGSILTSNGSPYRIFSQFHNKTVKIDTGMPITKKGVFSNYSHDKALRNLPKKHNISMKRSIIGGRSEAMRITGMLRSYENYAKVRDYPAKEGTTMLSAHLKFGTISPREAIAHISLELGMEHPLARQIAWREFYYHIAYHYPSVFGTEFRKEYAHIKWRIDDNLLDAWKKGITGFPIVDAGMRELKETGYMHNRLRMITASFLTKDLHIDWRLGEKHFANYLVDYDPAVNNGNWQWAASTGCDAQPYFRIFNPWLQQKKFDGNADYIKKWVRELEKHSADDIHNWHIKGGNSTYVLPIVDHAVQRKISLHMFRKG